MSLVVPMLTAYSLRGDSRAQEGEPRSAVKAPGPSPASGAGSQPMSASGTGVWKRKQVGDYATPKRSRTLGSEVLMDSQEDGLGGVVARAAGASPPAFRSPITADSPSEGPGPSSVHGPALEGTALLAFLPDGRFSGVFRGDSGGRALGIHGLVLEDRRECTRDEEWRLMRVTVTDWAAGGRAQSVGAQPCRPGATPRGKDESPVPRLQALCEKVGEDAACLRPLSLEAAQEEAAFAQHTRGCSEHLQLQFSCSAIHTGAKASWCRPGCRPPLQCQRQRKRSWCRLPGSSRPCCQRCSGPSVYSTRAV